MEQILRDGDLDRRMVAAAADFALAYAKHGATILRKRDGEQIRTCCDILATYERSEIGSEAEPFAPETQRRHELPAARRLDRILGK